MTLTVQGDVTIAYFELAEAIWGTDHEDSMVDHQDTLKRLRELLANSVPLTMALGDTLCDIDDTRYHEGWVLRDEDRESLWHDLVAKAEKAACRVTHKNRPGPLRDAMHRRKPSDH